MTRIQEIYDEINSFAPFHTAMDFDNVGLLVGDGNKTVTRSLLSLDITTDVVKEAHEVGAELIISHHPVIFQPLKNVSSESPVYLLAQYGISALCAHTNLDLAVGGVNTCLANRLQLENVQALCEYGPEKLSEGLIGELPKAYTPQDFAKYVKQKLGCGGLKYTVGKGLIQKVGICGGAGTDLLFQANSLGADAFVSADSKHHELIAATELGMTLVDAGHFCTEDVVIQPLLERLQQKFNEVVFKKSKKMQDPAQYL